MFAVCSAGLWPASRRARPARRWRYKLQKSSVPIFSQLLPPARLALAVALFFCLNSIPSVDAAGAKFGHGRKSHRPIPCSSCHSVSVARPNVTRFPGHKTCISCHNFAEMATRAFAGFCGVCHAGTPQSAVRPALFSFPRRNLAGEFGISFSHSAHLKAVLKSGAPDRTLGCRDCHSLVEPVGGRIPTPEVIMAEAHANCFRCHGMTP